ncbi:hypothetical protein C6I21_04360 [Alkalicoccus urumqiensis]|uniref:Uncharacterized protein n=1 Tax=Alkalicoccus urumqiensis TaxID=1548213 RepID=A0A2P6MJZ8_ALKUR|nr:hypothetical protein C6I21_04360 [Alkalicoccus urumqiensis]
MRRLRTTAAANRNKIGFNRTICALPDHLSPKSDQVPARSGTKNDLSGPAGGGLCTRRNGH